jgi:uncharacterized protein
MRAVMLTESAVTNRHVHLLFVPTIACNMECSYCYLGTQTDHGFPGIDAAEALDRALDLFAQADVLPFNLSLHGGEVTTLAASTLDRLFTRIRQHYVEHHDAIAALGMKKQTPHVKTNLLRFDRLEDLFDRHGVSVSASIDLPLSLHERYRRGRKDASTLAQTRDDLVRLGRYRHKANLSTTLFRPHFERREELADDIWTVHRELGYDMNRFNLMVGFSSGFNAEKMAEVGKEVLEPVNGVEQVELYHYLRHRFLGTELEYGLKANWFTEFTPDYCTHGGANCGERFLLLQADGEVWSCVRGQGDPGFHYGNLFTDGVETVLANAKRKILEAHRRVGFDEACRTCSNLKDCHTGCPFVKTAHQEAKSYTCDLQREMYADAPVRFPVPSEEERRRYSDQYVLTVHPDAMPVDPEDPLDHVRGFVTPSDVDEPEHRLAELIRSDAVLRRLYSSDDICLEVDGEVDRLHSQILAPARATYPLDAASAPTVHLCRRFFELPAADPQQTTVHIQLLRDTLVRYGDEQRLKQEHLITHEVYLPQLADSARFGPTWVQLPLGPLFAACADLFRPGVRNNCFITTNHLRRYHYDKQQRNGFYHVQALNLPFQHFLFEWR